MDGSQLLFAEFFRSSDGVQCGAKNSIFQKRDHKNSKREIVGFFAPHYVIDFFVFPLHLNLVIKGFKKQLSARPNDYNKKGSFSLD